jgi:hypothetical protein
LSQLAALTRDIQFALRYCVIAEPACCPKKPLAGASETMLNVIATQQKASH